MFRGLVVVDMREYSGLEENVVYVDEPFKTHKMDF